MYVVNSNCIALQNRYSARWSIFCSSEVYLDVARYPQELKTTACPGTHHYLHVLRQILSCISLCTIKNHLWPQSKLILPKKGPWMCSSYSTFKPYVMSAPRCSRRVIMFPVFKCSSNGPLKCQHAAPINHVYLPVCPLWWWGKCFWLMWKCEWVLWAERC